jgi:hypothetical protein
MGVETDLVIRRASPSRQVWSDSRIVALVLRLALAAQDTRVRT